MIIMVIVIMIIIIILIACFRNVLGFMNVSGFFPARTMICHIQAVHGGPLRIRISFLKAQGIKVGSRTCGMALSWHNCIFLGFCSVFFYTIPGVLF